MNKEKMKQYFKDYLDFVMPLIMVIVALNLVDLPMNMNYVNLWGKTYVSVPRFNFDNFFTIDFHLALFKRQIVENRLLIYTLMILVSALTIKLFTNRWMLIFAYPIKAIVFYIAFYEFFIAKRKEFAEVIIIFFEMTILFAISLFFIGLLRIFFTNCPIIINKISYSLISILGLFALLAYQFEMNNVLLVIKWILLFVILFLIVVALVVSACVKTSDIKIPQDVAYFKNEMDDYALAERIAKQEKRERKRIINDIADEVRKRL